VIFAMKTSLPGDWMYGVKVGMYEGAERTFVRTPEDRAALAVTHALRRIDDAEALAAGKTLTPETAVRISDSFREFITAACKQIGVFAAESPDIAATLSSHAQSILAARGVILRSLSNDASHLVDAMQQAERDLSAAGHNSVQTIVSGRQTSKTKEYAERALTDAKKQVSVATSLLGSDAEKNTQLSAAADALAAAQTQYEAGKNGAAFELAERAWRQATVILLTERAVERYGIVIR
jgi:hypothetical protein